MNLVAPETFFNFTSTVSPEPVATKSTSQNASLPLCSRTPKSVENSVNELANPDTSCIIKWHSKNCLLVMSATEAEVPNVAYIVSLPALYEPGTLVSILAPLFSNDVAPMSNIV